MLYPQLLGDDFEKLPRALREFHSCPGGGRAAGTIAVRHENPLLAWLVGFPRCGNDIPTQLTVESAGDCEVWIRRIGGVVRRSCQCRQGDLLLERLGPVRVAFRVSANETRLRFETEHATLWGVPVPISVTAEARGGEFSWKLFVAVKHVGWYEGEMAPLR